jgi:hypothetical protein
VFIVFSINHSPDIQKLFKADEPANEETEAVLEVGLFASEMPDVGHDGIAQTPSPSG